MLPNDKIIGNALLQQTFATRILEKGWSKNFDHKILQRTDTIWVFCNRDKCDASDYVQGPQGIYFRNSGRLWL